jgi:polyferredoxin
VLFRSRYSTENAVKGKYPDHEIKRHVVRPRVLIYTGLLVLIIIAFFVGLLLRSPLKVDVIRDRGAMVRDAGGGLIENVYRLQ